MTAHVERRRGRHDLNELASKPFASMTRGERIAAAKAGIVPGVRSQRERQLRSRYGLTLEAYDDLLKKQNHVCAACGKPWSGSNLYVDHDHRSGVVRGLLCPADNTLVGLIERSPDAVARAQKYLSGTDDRFPRDVPTS